MTVELNPNEEFTRRKDVLWNTLLEDKDYVKSAELASGMLQDANAFDAIHVAGLSLARLGHPEAFDWCCASLSLAKAEARWYGNCAVAFMEQKDYVRAMVFLENGIKDHPNNCQLMFQRCLCMANAQEWVTAVEFCKELIAHYPDFYQAYMTLGFSLHMLNKHKEAIDAYMHILDVVQGNEYEELVNNWSCVLMEMGQQQAALEILEKYCRDPNRTGTIYNKSFIYLGMGRWPEGWHMYKKRETAGIIEREKILPQLGIPFAENVDEIRGKRLFIFHEQGLGDDLQFIRYCALFRPLVSKLTVGVPPSMARLAGRLIMDGDYEVICGAKLEDDQVEIAKCDYAMPMLDAPAVLQHTVADIPNKPYFLPVPEDVIARRSIDGLCRRGKFRVGLCWAGSARPDNMRAHAIDKRRSAKFTDMQPLFGLRDRVEFVSLQLEDHRVDDKRIIQPLNNDFDVLDTAAVIAQLDLVISIDSSMAHLAGAFQKPIWMMSRLDQCWRWFWDGRTDSPWYPSLTIYQQKTAGDWAEVVSRIKRDLNALLNARVKQLQDA